jgi:hypothetical protein
LTQGTTGKLVLQHYQTDTSNSIALVSNTPIQLHQWQHLAFTFSSLTLKANIYVNGLIVATGKATSSPNNILRTSNFIGKSNWGNPNADAIFDELKIFSVALTQSQIKKEMSNEFYLSSLVQESIQLSQVSTYTRSNGKSNSFLVI